MDQENKKIICYDKDDKEYEVDKENLRFRPSVYGVLIEGGKILLSKQWDGYDFPGGGIEISETIEEALKREFFEETGLKVELIMPTHVGSAFFHPAHSSKSKNEYWNTQLMYFLVKKVGGELSKDNLDEGEKEYADLPEWLEIEKLNEVKFYNGVDSIEVIKKAKKIQEKL